MPQGCPAGPRAADSKCFTDYIPSFHRIDTKRHRGRLTLEEANPHYKIQKTGGKQTPDIKGKRVKIALQCDAFSM